MRSIWAVFKREMALYFRSPIAYAIAFAVMFFLGVVFNAFVVQANGVYRADSVYVVDMLTFLLFIIGPLLTMRLLAEESREGTLELLMTLPIKESQFIIGKFLAAWGYYTALLLLTVVHHIIMSMIGVPDLGETFVAYLGAWLYGGAVLSLTMIWSAVTEDQIVAAFLGAATVLVFYLAEVAAIWVAGQPNTAAAAEFIRALGFQSHFNATLLRGVIRAEDIAYFIFLIIGSLFITTRIVETRRWRA